MATGVKLEDAALLRDRCYVGGEWVGASGDGHFEVTNPATGERGGQVPAFSGEDTRRAI